MINKRLHTFVSLVVLCVSGAIALEVLTERGEREAVEHLAGQSEFAGAKIEVSLWDGTRCDMLTEEYAIEVDWSRKWGEAIGQSLYYAEVLQRKPGIILLVRDKRAEMVYVYRCQTVCAKYGIRLWVKYAVEKRGEEE